jgi:predicted nuclease with TOPRIM domain
MTHPEEQLKRVQDKLQQLIRLHQDLQKENEKLKGEFKKMTLRCDELSKEAERSGRQVDALKLSGSGLNEKGKKDLEKRLNQYVRDIDRCLALLNE